MAIITEPKDLARFWSRVDIMHPSGCWLWLGCTSHGYGQMGANSTVYPVHRISYEMHKGKIPEGLVIDHLCRVRNCVNPAHLEAVTNAENLRRGEHPKGGKPSNYKKWWANLQRATQKPTR